jgi:FkbM family methyltransferase
LRNQRYFDAATTYAQKSDIARYEIVERFGGVYIDTDFECLQPIDALLVDLSFFAGLQAGSTVNNGLFGASPHHPFLAAAVERLPASFIGRSGLGIPEQTGPEFFTRAIGWAAARASGESVGNYRIFPPAFFFPYLHSEPWLATCSFPTAYAVHHWASGNGEWAPSGHRVTPHRKFTSYGSRWPDELGDRIRLAPSAARERLAAERIRLEPVARGMIRRKLRSAVERSRSLGLASRTPAVYVGGGRLLVQTTWGSRLVVPAHDLSLTPYLALTGAYEANFAEYLARRLHPGDTVVDVGASIGLFTVLMAELVGAGGRVYAFECNPAVFEYLIDNVRMNWYSSRVIALPVAAGRDDSPITFAAPESLLMLGTTRLDIDIGQAEQITVDCERIDQRIDPDVCVELVKIDVEGAEVDVLAGLSRLLEERRLRTIMIELKYELQGTRWGEMCDVLTDLSERRGATFSALDDHGYPITQSLSDVLTVANYGNLIIDLPR